MTQTVPEPLREAANAALDWLNVEHDGHFEITGITEAESALQTPAGEPIELGLVLCDGEICTKQDVRITPAGGEFDIRLIDGVDPVIPPELDPPPKLRSEWLDTVLDKHRFVVLVVYRGFW